MAKAKKEKELKNFLGKDISMIEGFRFWVRCTTYDGERFNIPLRTLYDLLDKYEINCEKYGDRFRAKGFYKRDEIEDLPPLTYIEKLED